MPAPRSSDRLPRIEVWLVAAQVAAGLSVAAAWIGAGPTAGWPVAGSALIVAGLILAAAAGRALGPSLRIAPTPRAGARLVRHGIYRWLRHPMYVAVALVLTGVACTRPAWPVLLITSFNFVLYFCKARYEEGVLMRHYPDYARYRERTFGARARTNRPRREED